AMTGIKHDQGERRGCRGSPRGGGRPRNGKNLPPDERREHHREPEPRDNVLNCPAETDSPRHRYFLRLARSSSSEKFPKRIGLFASRSSTAASIPALTSCSSRCLRIVSRSGNSFTPLSPIDILPTLHASAARVIASDNGASVT